MFEKENDKLFHVWEKWIYHKYFMLEMFQINMGIITTIVL